eukprot:12715631-Alexandrium_andersonii.AAC.1
MQPPPGPPPQAKAPEMQPPPGPPPQAKAPESWQARHLQSMGLPDNGSERSEQALDAVREASAATSRSPSELVRRGAVPHTGPQVSTGTSATDHPAVSQPDVPQAEPAASQPEVPQAEEHVRALLRAKLRERKFARAAQQAERRLESERQKHRAE